MAKRKKFELDTTLSPERVWELFVYDPATGIIKWRHWRGRAAPRHLIAGSRKRRGHIEIRVGGHKYQAHRIAWALMLGHWPLAEIDHIDMDPGNNRWNNLREATGAQNQANRRALRTNMSGLKGVSPCYGAPNKATGVRPIRPGKFKAQIKMNGKVHYLGQFNSPELAHEAYKRAAILYHGVYARAE